ncbi:glycosyltransferase [Bifidobacterium apri]|uniref:glycosyltransferase n=1 Tax=Bifidobacterium apri TaxID=1769423 RepID=UPI00142EA93C|nr:glycosyltransferase [Bifidobacterium apri]
MLSLHERLARRSRCHSAVRFALLSVLVIVVLECVVFNLPYWTSVAASTDSPATLNTMGSGLTREASGTLEVTDQTKAFLSVPVDGSSQYVRIDLSQVTGATRSHLVSAVHVRLDSDGRAGSSTLIDVSQPRSLYLHTDAQHMVKLWIQAPTGTQVPIFAVRPNVRVAFQIDWLRVTVMAVIAILIACWRPRSRLWRIRADPGSVAQRLAFFTLMAVVGVASLTGAAVIATLGKPLVFQAMNGYTYDFDQYGHIADALLHGRVWLDLPVSSAFANSANPYDPALRERLLDAGTCPIYWDYAFYHGHWYSYFGVIPAIVLFVPYQALSHVVPGIPAMLPSASAVVLFLFGFVLFGSLLTIRMLRRVAPDCSVAGMSMALVTLLLGSNVGYLWLRTNFYSVPIAASLMFTSLGLWLWTGAERPEGSRRLWHAGDAPGLSLPRLAWGAACIAANAGCRPTFALTALLIFPLFWRQIRQMARLVRTGKVTRSLWAGPAAVILPAMAVVIPVFTYNLLRFDSLFDFGNSYQITVNDMTSYSEPFANIPWIIGYYLLLPPRMQSTFPFVAINPAPLPQWGFAEPMVAGLFAMCPMALLAFLIPVLRRHRRERFGALLSCMLMLGMAIMLVDAFKGGLGWRYICDFGWLITLASLPGLLWVLGEFLHPTDDTARSDGTGGEKAHDSVCPSASSVVRATGGWRAFALDCRRLIIMLLLLASILFLLASCFVTGRDDSLQRSAPDMFVRIQAWFALLE